MNLTFESQHEFETFAKVFMAGVAVRDGTGTTTVTHTVGAISQSISTTGAPEHVAAVIRDMTAALAEDGEQGEPQDGEQVVIDAGGATVTFDKVTIPDEVPEGENVQAEPPKRKRRTKAEIAAAEAAAKAATIAPIPGDAQDAADIAELLADHPEINRTPEADDGIAEVAAIATQVATTAASLATEAEAKVQAARAVYTPELVETLRGHAELFDNDRKAHLVEAREAIQKKGFIAYNATMQGLGLGPSVATYSDDEVKLHRAAIAHLLAS